MLGRLLASPVLIGCETSLEVSKVELAAAEADWPRCWAWTPRGTVGPNWKIEQVTSS